MAKKVLRVAGWLLLALLVVLLGCAIAIQSPKVQTHIAQRVTQNLQKKLGGDISFEKLQIHPFDAVQIQNITIIDRDPVAGTATAPQDTFFHADLVTAKFSLKGLFNPDGLTIKSAKVQGGRMALVTETKLSEDGTPMLDIDGYTKTTTNLARIFRLKESSDKKENDKTIFDIGSVEVKDFEFRMINTAHPSPSKEGAINWTDLDVMDINVKGKNLKMKGKVLGGEVQEGSFREKSGYRVEALKGRTSVGDGKADIKELHLKDGWSDLTLPTLVFSYDDASAWSRFVDDVTIDGTIDKGSRLSFESLGYFAPGLQKTKGLSLDLDGKVHGPVSELSVEGLNVKSGDIDGTVDGNISGLPTIRNTDVNAQVRDLHFTTEAIETLIKDISPSAKASLSKLSPGVRYTADVTARGPLRNMDVDLDLQGGESSLQASANVKGVVDKGVPITIQGDVATRNVDLGGILGTDALGTCSMQSSLSATLSDEGPVIGIDSVYIDRIGLLGREIGNVSATGQYTSEGFDGHVVSYDPSLEMVFDGKVTPSKENGLGLDFTADIAKADLDALGIDKREGSWASGLASGKLSIKDGAIDGKANIKDLELSDGKTSYDLGDANLVASSSDGTNSIDLYTDWADISFQGTGTIGNFISDAQELSTRRDMDALSGGSKTPWSGNTYSVRANLHDRGRALPYFKEGLYVADSTSALVTIDRSGLLKGKVLSPRIAIRDKFIKDADIDLDNASGKVSATVRSSHISAGPLELRDNTIVASVDDNAFNVRYSFDNGSESGSGGTLHLGGDLSRSWNDKLRVDAQTFPTKIRAGGQTWDIHSSGISFCDGEILADGFQISSGEQFLKAHGGVSKNSADTLDVKLNRFNIGVFQELLGDGISIEGLASGNARMVSPTKEGLRIDADIQSDSTYLMNESLGTLYVKSTFDKEADRVNLSAYNNLNYRRNIDLSGHFRPSDKYMEGKVVLDSLKLAYAAPFLRSVFSSMGGCASGELALSGPLKELSLSSQGIHLDDALLTVDYTKVPYIATGMVTIDDSGAHFEKVSLKDEAGDTGRVSGSIGWNHFKDISLDLGIVFREMEVLRLRQKDNPTFYGNIFGTGRVGITGPLSAILLDIRANTTKDGDFHLPLGGSDAKASGDLLVFTQREAPRSADPYDDILQRIAAENASAKKSSGSDLQVKLNVGVHPGIKAYIEIDKETRNMLTGYGDGLIELDVRPNTGVFNLTGNYELEGGNYHFEQLGIINKDFDIKQGSNVQFAGDVMSTQLDIDAVYKLKTNINTLIADSTSTVRRTVECGIKITDQLRNPSINFTIDIPDLDPTTQSKVQNALSTTDQVQKQFLSLLISGGFLPDEQSGIFDSSTMMASTVTEMMANQLNNILSSLNIPLDLGLGYQQSTTGSSDVFDVAVSTALWDDRVIINGVIGNKQNSYLGYNEMAGDLDVEIKIDKPGSLRLKLFSHSADAYTSLLDNSQRNGVGVTYQKEFDTLSEFFKGMFTFGRRKVSREALPPQEAPRVEAPSSTTSAREREGRRNESAERPRRRREREMTRITITQENDADR